MITGTTKSGFDYAVREDLGGDYRFVDAYADARSGDPDKMLQGTVRLVRVVLGEAGARRLMDHVAEEDGRVPTERMDEEIIEILGAIKEHNSALKN